ncbi:MAG TPA: hypothetical protein VGQ09_03990 [Chitinophagaceae bacterium]|jgi:hypothetical protein|nr:hypothetical protein [Chitinophagaceae bacterium]
MKVFFALLVLPLFSASQTVHVKDGSILYEGKEKVTGVSASEIYNRIQHILPSLIDDYQIEKQSANAVRARGELNLKTPFNIIRTVHYSMELRAVENGYEYLIDSVSFTERKRGEKPSTKSSKEVLDNMSEQGAIVGETERLLNETDMRFQKLLAVLRTRVKSKK